MNSERDVLLKLLSLAKEKVSQIDRQWRGDMPCRAAAEWSDYKGCVIYLESKLYELNLKEKLYEHQDSYR